MGDVSEHRIEEQKQQLQEQQQQPDEEQHQQEEQQQQLRKSGGPQEECGPDLVPEGNAGKSSEKQPPRSNGVGRRSNPVTPVRGPRTPASTGSTSKASPSPRLKATRSNFTVPQPFSLTTEKRASAGVGKSQDNGSTSVHTPPPAATPPASARTPHALKKVASPSPPQVVQHGHGSPSSGFAGTSKNNVEFVFRSDERAQKRMEFYANLSEKSKAREAERNRMQAKSQQQIAAEIKKLRKDQTFKATPMPKFYQEPPPVRVDVKKTPPTRPKSPKLGRRAPASAGRSGAPPKIIARRSSDEYQKASDTNSPSEQRSVDASDDHEHHDDKESERSTSTNVTIPKAALSETEEPERHAEEEAEETTTTSRPESSLAAFDGIMQLPVSSSLLNDDDEDDVHSLSELEQQNGGAEYELHHHHDHHQQLLEDDLQENLKLSSGGGGAGGGHVRVFISEEFRQQAASEVHEFHPDERGEYEDEADDEDGEDEEMVDEDEDYDDEDQPKAYVNLEDHKNHGTSGTTAGATTTVAR